MRPVFFLFISLLLPAHDVTEGNVDTLLDTIRSRSLLQFRIHLVLPSESGSVFEGSGSGGNNRDNRPGIKGCPCVPVNGSDAIQVSLDLSLSEGESSACSGFSLRQHSLRSGSHAKHTSIPVSVPSPSVACLTSSTR